MTRVAISELKAHLSRYLREVRRGGEVQVLDRGVPVARIVGVRSDSQGDQDRRTRLVKSGVLRSGSGDASEALAAEPLEVSTSILAALAEERLDRV